MQCSRISRTLCSASTQTLSTRTPSSSSLKWTGGSTLTCITSMSSSPSSTKSLLKAARSNNSRLRSRPCSRASLISTSRNYRVLVNTSILAHTEREAPCLKLSPHHTRSKTANFSPIEMRDLSQTKTSTFNIWTKQVITPWIEQSSLRIARNSRPCLSKTSDLNNFIN